MKIFFLSVTFYFLLPGQKTDEKKGFKRGTEGGGLLHSLVGKKKTMKETMKER